MSNDPRNEYFFSVWSDVQGFVTYTIKTFTNITIWDAFKRIAAKSQGGDLPIPMTYRGQTVRWSFAYGPGGAAPEYIDPDLTFEQLGIPAGETITIGPIDILGAGFLSRVRYDRRQLAEFINLNNDLLEPIKTTPTTFRIKIKNLKGIIGVDNNGRPFFTREHEFAIILGSDYPLSEPLVKPVSAIFHPNVSMSEGKICAWVDYRPDRKQMLPWICFQVVDLITFRKVTLEEPHRLMNERASEWYEEQKRVNPKMFPISNKTFRPLSSGIVV